MADVAVKKITKIYNNQTVLEDISFDVKDGDIVAILGPSGCGKTTLLKCILGLENSDKGEIYIDSKKQTDWLKNNRVAYVPQKYSNFNHLTVEQNILAALTNSGDDKKQIVEKI